MDGTSVLDQAILKVPSALIVSLLYPIGFQCTHVEADPERILGQKAERQGRLHLQEALRRGWLREHPMLAGIVAGAIDGGICRA